MDYSHILNNASRIAQQAGVILRTQFSQPVKEIIKSSAIDIVTETDKEAEAFITRELLRLYPEHHLVGEEGGGQGAALESATYHWYIDPIDGTTNFANGIPQFCVSLAMTDANRDPLIAVIYDPMLDELYTAIKGEGAYRNGQSLQVTHKDTLLQAVIGSGFPYTKHTDPDNNTAQWAAFTRRVRGIRRMGSAALDLAYVAAGRLDGYWERSLNPWDAMAGMLLVREAGGTITDYEGGNTPQHDPRGRYVASNGHLHQQMLDILNADYDFS
ncbi:MAG: inositol monophosphatase family protein [Phototrophicaceae bacterium]